MSTNDNMEMSASPPGASASQKYGTLVPNRIFVGGISANTTEADLHSVFSRYGHVKATKIITDRTGISKGYGFVTFETEEEAQRIQREVDNVVLKERKLNIAPAIKKQQPFARVIDPSQVIPNGAVLYPTQMPSTYGNSQSSAAGTDSVYVPQAAYPLVYQHPVYLPPHQYHYHPSANASYPTQYVYATLPPAASASSPGGIAGSANEMYQYNPLSSTPTVMQVVHPGAYTSTTTSSEYADSTASEASSEGIKTSYFKTPTSSSGSSDSSEHPHTSSQKTSSRIASNAVYTRPTTYVHALHQLSDPSIKAMNGVTVLAYPSPFMMGPHTLWHLKDPAAGDNEQFLTEVGYLHTASLQNSALPLSPPPTPVTPVTCEFKSNCTNTETNKKS